MTKLKPIRLLFRWQTLFASLPIPLTLLFFHQSRFHWKHVFHLSSFHCGHKISSPIQLLLTL